MAAPMIRLRRAVLPSVTAISRSISSSGPAAASPLPPTLPWPPTSTGLSRSLPRPPPFRATHPSHLSTRSSTFNNLNDGDDKIDPDTILFEGCDFNHWLITMDFPKDPKPSPEEMVRTYEETCAKGLNISLEEAKNKIYACSTTTYQGFQAVMTEAESEQFRGLPGVVFILPDSYIDPQNKQYGGDKYENGVITHRPPPIQYGRPRGRRRNYDQPRFDGPGGQIPNRQGNPQYDYQAQGPRQQNYPPQQNYGPPGQFDQRNAMPANNYNYGGQNYPPQQNYGPPGQVDQRNPMPTNNYNYNPGGGEPYQTQRRDQMPSHGQGNYAPPGGTYGQGDRWNQGPPMQNDFGRDNQNYAPPVGNYGQGADGSQSQVPGGPYGPGPNASYGHGDGQRYSPVDQRNFQGDQRSYGPGGQGGRDQGRF